MPLCMTLCPYENLDFTLRRHFKDLTEQINTEINEVLESVGLSRLLIKCHLNYLVVCESVLALLEP
jgi:hypothetical protein